MKTTLALIAAASLAAMTAAAQTVAPAVPAAAPAVTPAPAAAAPAAPAATAATATPAPAPDPAAPPGLTKSGLTKEQYEKAEALLNDRCNACHNSEIILASGKNLEGWRGSVATMAAKWEGAFNGKFTDAEQDIVARYLAVNVPAP